ncbi:MAG: DNA topoisomerase 4 subunit A [Clostridia bacterium]|nr:DNA topoisomerase 4 subunit A [Clostridia bacterium]
MEESKQLAMSEITRVFDRPIDEVIHDAMMPFAEYVILDRALPRVEDGLKPVQRRILYSMRELGITPDKPHRKCARIVGECLGKYHPHGDTSVYDALVRMAQPFNMSATLVDGHGNYGSMDGDPAAAMRYTEARLSPLALELLRDIDKDTVKYSLNFDDTTEEPDMLPGRYPNLLVNGASGIAVGLATNIPPHNINEVIDGTVAIIDNPKISLAELMKIIKAPDFPTGGIVITDESLVNAYESGKGKIIMRAKVHIEKDGDKKNIVITEFPYQVNKATLLQKIAEFRESRKELYSGIQDIVDESDRNGIRSVIKLKRDADHKKILALLMKQTELSKSFAINMVAIANGKPKQMGLLEILSYYIEFQRTVIYRRTAYDLSAAKERSEILSGLLIAINNVDEVVRIIKKAGSVTEAKAALRQRFELSEKQANAILEMKLRRLTHLEVDELVTEIEALKITIEELTKIYNSKKLQLDVVKSELKDIKKRFKQDRKCEIIYGDAEIDVPVDDGTKPVVCGALVLLENGSLKFINQRCYGQVNSSADIPDADSIVKSVVNAGTDMMLYGFTDKGNYIRIPVDAVPEKKWREKGTALLKLVPDADPDEKLIMVLPVREDDADNRIISFLSTDGMIKYSELSEYKINKTYSQALVMNNESQRVVMVSLAPSSDKNLLVVTRNGMCVNMSTEDIPVQGRRSKGVKTIALADNDSLIFGGYVEDAGELIVINSKGEGKKILIADFEVTKRNRKGTKVMNGVKFADTVTMPYMLALIMENDEVEMISSEMILILSINDAGEYLPSSTMLKLTKIAKHKTDKE